MSLLDNLIPFNETLFLKSDSNLEKELIELKKIQENNKSSELDKDIKLLEMGLNGEKQIEYELKNANLGLYVLHDITLEIDGLTAQIDYMVISKGYTYLIECKNMIGNIKVDSQGQFTREYALNGKKIRESIYSPYSQAYRHLDIIKKIWINHSSKLKTILFSKNIDTLWYKPLVVMCNSKGILDTKYAPKDVKSHTIRVDNLVKFIKDDLNKYDKNLYSNKKNMESLANNFIDLSVDKKMNFVDKYKKKIDGNNNLRSELVSFRKDKSEQRNIPAYYIFTNEELDKILKLKPKNKDELGKIISEVKVKFHGDEIIKIINKDSNNV